MELIQDGGGGGVGGSIGRRIPAGARSCVIKLLRCLFYNRDGAPALLPLYSALIDKLGCGAIFSPHLFFYDCVCIYIAGWGRRQYIYIGHRKKRTRLHLAHVS